jgi:hypothetical protein
VLKVSWRKTGSKRRREILLPVPVPPHAVRPIRSETRATLVASIARGRRWLNEMIMDSTANAESIAARDGCQRPPGQHDNLAGLLSTQSGEGRDRRPTAARNNTIDYICSRVWFTCFIGETLAVPRHRFLFRRRTRMQCSSCNMNPCPTDDIGYCRFNVVAT